MKSSSKSTPSAAAASSSAGTPSGKGQQKQQQQKERSASNTSNASASNGVVVPPPSASKAVSKANNSNVTSASSSSSSNTNTNTNSSSNNYQFNLPYCPVIFSADGKFVLYADSKEVVVASMATGQVVHSLAGHSAQVTGIVAHHTNVTQVYTSSLDGSVLLWDFLDATLLATRKCDFPVCSLTGFGVGQLIAVFAIPPESQETKASKENALSGRVVLLDMIDGSSQNLFNCFPRPPITVSPDFNCVLAGSGNQLIIWDKRRETTKQVTTVRHRHRITSIAVCPTGASVAVGDYIGEIVMFYNCLEVSGVGVSSSHSNMHWHAHSVRDLAFTPDAIHLASIGEEGVLVVWSMESGARRTLPRLGAPLNALAFSPKAERVALMCDDNTLRVVDLVSFSLEHTIRGLCLGHYSIGNGTSMRQLVVIPTLPEASGSSAIAIVNGYASSIQFYDVNEQKHILHQEIAGGGNVISRTDFNPLLISRVLAVVFSSDCTSMATLHFRPSPYTAHNNNSNNNNQQSRQSSSANSSGNSNSNNNNSSNSNSTVPSASSAPSSSSSSSSSSNVATAPSPIPSTSHLRFWDYKSKEQGFVLNTAVENPHRHQRVSGLAYHPRNNIVATAGLDGCWKLWRRIARAAPILSVVNKSTDKEETRDVWGCAFAASFRRSLAGEAHFSPDGSLLAVAYGPTVSLWDHESAALRAALTTSPPVGSIKHMSFIPNSTCLAATTASRLTVWNITSCTPLYTWDLSISAISSHPKNGHFAVASHVDGESHVLVFSTQNAAPVAVWSLGEGKIDSLVFHKSDNNTNSSEGSSSNEVKAIGEGYALLGRTSSQTLVSLPVASKKARVKSTGALVHDNNPLHFSSIFLPSDPATQQQQQQAKAVPEAAAVAAHRENLVPSCIEGPAHTLPPPSSFLPHFFHDLLRPSVPERPEEAPRKETDEQQQQQKEQQQQHSHQAQPMEVDSFASKSSSSSSEKLDWVVDFFKAAL